MFGRKKIDPTPILESPPSLLTDAERYAARPYMRFTPAEEPKPPSKPQYVGAMGDVQKLRDEKQAAARHELLRLACSLGSGKAVAPERVLAILDAAGADEAALQRLVEAYRERKSLIFQADAADEAEVKQLRLDAELSAALAAEKRADAALTPAQTATRDAASRCSINGRGLSERTNAATALKRRPEFAQFTDIEPLEIV